MNENSEPIQVFLGTAAPRTRRGLAQFVLYALVGVLNTAVHWATFFLLVYLFDQGQGLSNLIAFLAAVTVSFITNSKVTFRSGPSLKGYLKYVAFLGMIAYLTGAAAARAKLPPVVSLLVFSVVSLIIGYVYSRMFVFKQGRA